MNWMIIKGHRIMKELRELILHIMLTQNKNTTFFHPKNEEHFYGIRVLDLYS